MPALAPLLLLVCVCVCVCVSERGGIYFVYLLYKMGIWEDCFSIFLSAVKIVTYVFSSFVL